MFKMLNPRRFYHAVGRKKFLEFILLAVFILFFYGPLLNMLMLAFSNEYTVPHIFPEEWGVQWWSYVFGQDSLVSSMIQSFVVAIATTLISMVFCIPAAYSIARFKYKGRKILIDCGEGTQVSMREINSGFKSIDIICITHIHGDHIIGLPGILGTIGNSGRQQPLYIIGPEGIKEAVAAARVIAKYLPYEVIVIENPQTSIEGLTDQL